MLGKSSVMFRYAIKLTFSKFKSNISIYRFKKVLQKRLIIDFSKHDKSRKNPTFLSTLLDGLLCSRATY